MGKINIIFGTYIYYVDFNDICNFYLKLSNENCFDYSSGWPILEIGVKMYFLRYIFLKIWSTPNLHTVSKLACKWIHFNVIIIIDVPIAMLLYAFIEIFVSSDFHCNVHVVCIRKRKSTWTSSTVDTHQVLCNRLCNSKCSLLFQLLWQWSHCLEKEKNKQTSKHATLCSLAMKWLPALSVTSGVYTGS